MEIFSRTEELAESVKKNYFPACVCLIKRLFKDEGEKMGVFFSSRHELKHS